MTPKAFPGEWLGREVRVAGGRVAERSERVECNAPTYGALPSAWGNTGRVFPDRRYSNILFTDELQLC